MTDTINNVPRELKPVLAMILNALDRDAEDGKQARAEMAAELRALLSAPSPAVVDGLEAFQFDWATCNSISNGWPEDVFPLIEELPDEPLCRLSDATAIIDGLRGEVEDLIEARDSRVSARIAILDQQAQRIGELEGLLRACHSALYPFDNKMLESEIDAALPAGKEGE